MPKAVRKLADRYLNDPKEIARPIRSKFDCYQTEQRYYYIHKDKKLAALVRLLRSEEVTNALIFARTKISAHQIGDELIKRGYKAEYISWRPIHG